MGDDRDAGMSHATNQFGMTEVDFELHGIRVTFDEKATGVSQSLFMADLVAHERHVADHPAVRGPPLHRRGEGDEKFQGRMNRPRQTENDLGCGVSDQEDRNTGCLHVPGSQGVVGGQAGKGLPRIDHPLERSDRDRALDGLELDLSGSWGTVGSGGEIHVGCSIGHEDILAGQFPVPTSPIGTPGGPF